MPKNPALSLSTGTLIVLIIVFGSMTAFGIVLAGYGSLDLIPSGQYVKVQANEAMRGEICPFSVDFNQPFDLLLSDNVTFRLTGFTLESGFYLNRIGLLMFENVSDSQFSIHFYNQKMYVNADIRDSENKPIANIVNNTWTTVNPSYALSYWDRNYNGYAFEIVNSKGTPTFAVAMVGPNRIRLNGLFYYTSGGSVYVGALPDGTAEICFNAPYMHQEDNISWATLFKYPVLTNPANVGVINKPIYPTDNPLAEAEVKIQAGYNFFYFGSIITAFSLVVLPMAVTALQEKCRKPQPSVQPIIQYYNTYYYHRRKKRGKKSRRRKR
ncbi:MAG: hypothetical protein ACE14S_01345 [Candidatus Bathyarchaeia archaeon]